MNSIMYDGKKSVAETIVYGALDLIESKAKQDPLDVFHQALDNVDAGARGALAPRRRRHLSGAGRGSRRSAARRWPSAGSSTPRAARNEKTMIERLSGELLDAANNRGTAVKKREDTHRMAEANRAFSHYRW